MVTSWEPESEEEQPQEPSYQVSAHIVLEDSATQTWGMVRDTGGSFIWEPGQGELVGKWSRSPSDGSIHVFLETPIQALVDKATQRFAEYAEKRRMEPTKSTKARRAPKAPKEPEQPSEESLVIANLRNLIKR